VIDKQNHVTLSYYSHDQLKRLNPTKRQKLWQLRNLGKPPGTGPARRDHNASVASTSTKSSGTVKRQVEDSAVEDDQPANDLVWGRNRFNPALGHQVCFVAIRTDIPSLVI
jgi:hypothetical protein